MTNRRDPLAEITSIKVKFGVVIVVAVVVAAAVTQLGERVGWPVWSRLLGAALVSLLMVAVLARGMTRPLREMADAARAMARGDFGRRVDTASTDEVGQLAAAFNAMSARLEQLDQERRLFVATAAHELRTPVTALQATFENLDDGVIDATPEVVARLRSQTERLSRLIAAMLDLSRLESPSAPLVTRNVDLSAIIERGVRAGTARHSLTVDPDAPGTVLADVDGDLFEQLITNLVHNAVVHGAGADIAVQLKVDNDTAVIEVSDRGPGFGDLDPELLFDYFTRSETGVHPGAGLGLAICRAIVERHNGTISAAANQPTGCVITTRIPLLPTTTPTATRPSSTTTNNPPNQMNQTTLPTPLPLEYTPPQPPSPRRTELVRPGLVLALIGAAFAILPVDRELGSLAVGGLFAIVIPLTFWSIVVDRWVRGAALVATLAFVPWFVIRASPLLLVVNLLALLTICVHLVSVRRDAPIAPTWTRLFRQWFDAGLHSLSGPVVLGRHLRATQRDGGVAKTIAGMRAAIVPVAVLLIVCALLISGDALFASYIDIQIDDGTVARIVSGLFGIGLFLAAIGAASRPAPTDDSVLDERTYAVNPLTILIGLGGLAAILVAFGAVQLSAALLGDDYVAERTGLTYAEWARSGFFQLVAVAMIAAVGVGAASAVTSSDSQTHTQTKGQMNRSRRVNSGVNGGDNDGGRFGMDRWLMIASASVTAGVLALVVASFVKLGLYMDAFGLTLARLYTAVFSVGLGFVAVVLLAAVFGFGRRWAPTVVVAAALVGAFAMNVINPEPIVVDHNIDRFVSGEQAPATGGEQVDSDRLDIDYLVSMSSDAVPTLLARADQLAAADRAYLSDFYCRRATQPSTGGLNANLAVSAAANALAEFCNQP